MGDFTLPDTEKYAALPKNFRGFVKETFQEKTGKDLNPFLEKRTIFPPALGQVFNEIVDFHHDYWKAQLIDGKSASAKEVEA